MVEAALSFHEEIADLELDVRRQFHILHSSIGNIKFLLELLHLSIHTLNEYDQVSENVGVHKASHE